MKERRRMSGWSKEGQCLDEGEKDNVWMKQRRTMSRWSREGQCLDEAEKDNVWMKERRTMSGWSREGECLDEAADNIQISINCMLTHSYICVHSCSYLLMYQLSWLVWHHILYNLPPTSITVWAQTHAGNPSGGPWWLSDGKLPTTWPLLLLSHIILYKTNAVSQCCLPITNTINHYGSKSLHFLV